MLKLENSPCYLEVENPPRILCRLTQPDKIRFDDEGNFLPHNLEIGPTPRKTVPLVHPAELQEILAFMLEGWYPQLDPNHFVILLFHGHLLPNLRRRNPNRCALNKYGEHFAVANIAALKNILSCKAIIEDYKLVKYLYLGKYQLSK